MPLPPCSRCGKTNPRRMIGLMTLWFGPFVDMRPDQGYFYLCPGCYRERVKPHLDEVQGRLAELHPLARHLGLHVEPPHQGLDQDPERDDDSTAEPEPGETPSSATNPRVVAGGRFQS